MLNMAISPASHEMHKKFFQRWKLKTWWTGASTRHSLFSDGLWRIYHFRQKSGRIADETDYNSFYAFNKNLYCSKSTIGPHPELWKALWSRIFKLKSFPVAYTVICYQFTTWPLVKLDHSINSAVKGSSGLAEKSSPEFPFNQLVCADCVIWSSYVFMEVMLLLLCQSLLALTSKTADSKIPQNKTNHKTTGDSLSTRTASIKTWSPNPVPLS